jgi:hypothetical protein
VIALHEIRGSSEAVLPATAAIQAAYRVLSTYFTDNASATLLNTARQKSLAAIMDGSSFGHDHFAC